jgi:hypothetical protein
VRIIACISDVFVINKILTHLDKYYPVTAQANLLPPLRAPPEFETTQQNFSWGA